VADTGRQRPHGDDQLVRVGRDGRVGLKVAVAGAGKARAALDQTALLEEARAAGAAEEKRLFYVACTRAEERLIVSGSVSFRNWPKPESSTGPAIAWLGPALVPELRASAEAGETAGETDGVAWRISRPAQAGPELRPPRASAPADADPAAAGAPPPEPVAPAAPGAGALPVDHVSYSSLESHRRCGYRFYLERVLRLPPRDEPFGRGAAAAAADTGLAPTVRGSIAHLLLEGLDPRHPAEPGPLELDAAAALAGAGPLEDADRADLLGLVAAFARSELRERLAGADRVAHEEPFSFALGDLLVEGFLDVLAWEGERALVVDYKTNRLMGREPSAIVAAEYAVQRLVYALAVLRAGAAEVEVAFSFLERADEPVVARFAADEAPALTAALGERVAAVRAGQWDVSPAPNAELCHGCPGRGTLCTWPLEATRAEPADEAEA
jgi:ATP-dependent exoDNAse (exonuclease V) beta subunit